MGVHQIFQMAIAAEELGCLSGLQCSVFDAPGKWGGFLSRFLNMPSAFPLGSESLPPGKVHELPLPQLARQAVQKVCRNRHLDPLPFLQAFERMAARRLARSGARIAVAAETCALGYFMEAKKRGMLCVLDSHGIPTFFLDDTLRCAAAEFGLPSPAPCDSPAMSEHKQMERELADTIFFCSQLQKDIWIKQGLPREKCHAIPLWADPEFWKPSGCSPPAISPLRVASVGAGTLAKGLPYLIQATDLVGNDVLLSLVGGISKDMAAWVAGRKTKPVTLPYMSRTELRNFLHTQHLLVMPSLGDSFGFIAMEAMACGLPVIVTDHCGVPVPDPSWRIPALNADAIANRVGAYVQQQSRLENDGLLAQKHASTYTPDKYRAEVRRILSCMMS